MICVGQVIPFGFESQEGPAQENHHVHDTSLCCPRDAKLCRHR